MNYLDTRDLYKQHEELKDELSTLQDAVTDAQEALDYAVEENEVHGTDDTLTALEEAQEALEEAQSYLVVWYEDNLEEFYELENLLNELSYCWLDGETMIPDSEFESYARELAEELGACAGDCHSWLVIDWEATADGLKQGYMLVTYQGTDYWVRS